MTKRVTRRRRGPRVRAHAHTYHRHGTASGRGAARGENFDIKFGQPDSVVADFRRHVGSFDSLGGCARDPERFALVSGYVGMLTKWLQGRLPGSRLVRWRLRRGVTDGEVATGGSHLRVRLLVYRWLL